MNHVEDLWTCFRSPFSAVFQYQKKFTGDILDQVKIKREAFNRRAKDLRNRHIELHLDELEEKYLCCVCLKKGEEREDEIELVMGKYRIGSTEAKRLAEASQQESQKKPGKTSCCSRQNSGALQQSHSRPHTPSPPIREAAASSRSGSNSATTDADDDVLKPHTAEGNRESPRSAYDKAELRAELEVMHMIENEKRRREKTQCQQESALTAATSGDESCGGKAVLSRASSGRSTPALGAPITARPGLPPPSSAEAAMVISPFAVKQLIDQTRKQILEAQRIARIEELARSGKLKKKQAYHRDRGLMRIHETDIEHFSIFFKRPVRGYLCEECFGAAKKKLDRLTHEVSSIINRAKEPPIRRKMTKGPTLLAAPDVKSVARASSALQHVEMGILPDSDVLQLRLLMRCGVCQRRQASYFFRKTVLFLCEFCTAADKAYRDQAMLVCDDPMPVETITLLRSLRKTAEAARRGPQLSTKTQAAAAVRDFTAEPTLFDACNTVDLFRVQDSELAASKEQLCGSDSLEPPGPRAGVLQPHACFSSIGLKTRHENGSLAACDASRSLSARTAARESGMSLFAGSVLKPAVDLFHSWANPPAVERSRAECDVRFAVAVVEADALGAGSTPAIEDGKKADDMEEAGRGRKIEAADSSAAAVHHGDPLGDPRTGEVIRADAAEGSASSRSSSRPSSRSAASEASSHCDAADAGGNDAMYSPIDGGEENVPRSLRDVEVANCELTKPTMDVTAQGDRGEEQDEESQQPLLSAESC
jgi:hypothetical protein